MIKRFTSAKENGWIFANCNSAKYFDLGELILDAMINNPFKSEKARKDYISGVESRCTELFIARTRHLVG